MTAPTPSLRDAAQMALDALAGAIKTNQFDMLMTGQECRDGEASIKALSIALALPDKPVLYRYQGSESVIPVMPGYSPGPGWTPLYAHQPAPLERQPLTDDQIEDMRGDASRGSNIEREDYFKAVRDAEAAHGIK